MLAAEVLKENGTVANNLKVKCFEFIISLFGMSSIRSLFRGFRDSF